MTVMSRSEAAEAPAGTASAATATAATAGARRRDTASGSFSGTRASLAAARRRRTGLTAGAHAKGQLVLRAGDVPAGEPERHVGAGFQLARERDGAAAQAQLD